MKQEDQKYFGLGIILNEGLYVCIDINNCLTLKDGSYNTNDYVQKIVDSFSETYCEISLSPSGRGLHILFISQWNYKKERGIYKIDDSATIEVYSGQP